MDYCTKLFCGCEYYISDTPVETKIYLTVGFTLLIIALSVRIGSEWFIFKDYYPMKQRSPVLCILMLIVIAIQLILYPLFYTFNYFTRNWGDCKYIYRTIFYALDGSLYFIYLLRSLRLVYAHEIDTSRSKTIIFRFFKNEYLLVLFTFAMIMIKIIPILTTDFQVEDLFFTFIDINTYTFNDGSASKQLAFGIKNTIHQFLWLSIIIYCLYLQTLVHKSYSMKNELLMVFGSGFIFNLSSIILYSSQIQENNASIINSICLLLTQYPLLQMIRDLNVLCLFGISIVYPIFKKRIYHMMLPIGRHHDIVKTMRDFLMINQFIDIFAAFLKHIDDQRDLSTYTDTLENWKKLIVIKYKITNKEIDDQQKFLQAIKKLIDDIEYNPFKELNLNLLDTLKKSILSLQECQQQTQSQQRFKLMDEISEKIQDLQLIFLEKLDQIYKSQYRQTKSYYYLKMYMIRNKKININMITMGMAVMVQNQDAL